MNVCKLITVKGRVQGVGYRFAAKHVAEKMNITGSVKNMPDGSVEMIACGNDTLISKYISWCGDGPIRAKVSHLNVIDMPYQHYKKYSIL